MTLLAVLVAFALLLLFVGVLLLVAVVVLFFVLRRGEAEPEAAGVVVPAESPRAPFPDPSREPAAPPVPPALVGNPAGSLGGDLGANLQKDADGFGPEDEEVAKTEVFTRGSLNLDWDDDAAVEGATEIFRADEYDFE